MQHLAADYIISGCTAILLMRCPLRIMAGIYSLAKVPAHNGLLLQKTRILKVHQLMLTDRKPSIKVHQRYCALIESMPYLEITNQDSLL